MFRKFRLSLCLEGAVQIEVRRVAPKIQSEWLRRLSSIESSKLPFSPKSVMEVLDLFRREYCNGGADKRVRREMINEASFIRLLSSCMRHLESFSAVDLVKMLHILTIGIDWKDKTLLRSVEPVVIARLPTLPSASVVEALESFSKLKCGSRPFWESMISAITSVELVDSEVLRVVKVVCENPKSFYKPTYVLGELFPILERMEFACNSDLCNCMKAYSRWENALKSSDKLLDKFLLRLLSELDFTDFDIEVFSEVLSVITSRNLTGNEVNDFLKKFRTSIITAKDPSPEAIQRSLTGLFKLGSMECDHQHHTKAAFVYLAQEAGRKISKLRPKHIPCIVSVCARVFGLVHSPTLGGSAMKSFGPPSEGEEEAVNFPQLAIAHIVKNVSEFSPRQIARLMESFAVIRLGSPELWAGLTTALSQHACEEVSPEELNGILFALGEMQVEVSQAFKNSIILNYLEKINLMNDNYNCFLFFLAASSQSSELYQSAAKAIEMMDIHTAVLTSKHPSVVLLNLAIRCLVHPPDISGDLSDIIALTNEDLFLFLSTAQSIIHPEILKSISIALSQHLHSTAVSYNVNLQGLLVDLLFEKEKIAILISSPLQCIRQKFSSRPTGTALLRHRATQTALGAQWRVCNINAADWLAADSNGRKHILDSMMHNNSASFDEIGKTHPEETNEVDQQSSHTEELDITPFVRKERLNPHRNGAPPSDALPWIPTVLSLKTKRRRNRTR